ncbi:myosin heavy chain clone, putative [Entamoeba histolytica KU27]|uniref:Myosin heavy chain clone, putative n=1 Tax=Entamoeba histolytica KU27 TaxID=885311 RepID=M2RP95_ENTHI|nr:myosin heavy chain clone, putative [Entamoeba histolytica KU27]
MPRYHIEHLLREIRRKKISTVLYCRIEEEIKGLKDRSEKMRSEVSKYRTCSNREEQERLNNMKDTIFRDSREIEILEEKSKELVNNIKEPSFVESVIERSEKRMKEIEEEREKSQQEIIMLESDINKLENEKKGIENKISKSEVEAVKEYYQEEREDINKEIEKKKIRIKEKKSNIKEGIKTEKEIIRESKNKIEKQEEEEISSIMEKIQSIRKELKKEKKISEERAKKEYEVLKRNQTLSELETGKILEESRVREMRIKQIQRDIIDLERRSEYMKKEREIIRKKRMEEAISEVKKEEGKRKKKTKEIIEAKEELSIKQKERIEELEFEYFNLEKRISLLNRRKDIIKGRNKDISRKKCKGITKDRIKEIEENQERIKKISERIKKEEERNEERRKEIEEIKQQRKENVEWIRKELQRKIQIIEDKKKRIQRLVNKIIKKTNSGTKEEIRNATNKMRDINKSLQPLNIIEKTMKQKVERYDEEIIRKRIEEFEKIMIHEAQVIIHKKDVINNVLIKYKRRAQNLSKRVSKCKGKLSPKFYMRRDKIYKKIKKEEEKLKLVGEEAIKKARNIEKYLLEMNRLFERKLKIDQIRIKKLLKMRDTIVCQISRKFYDNNIKSLTNDIKIRRHQNKHINVILNNLIKELRNPNGKYLISIVNDTNSLQQICSICENIGNYVIDKIAKGTSQHLLTKNVLNYCQSSPNERLCLESFMKIQLIDLSHDLPASGNQLCTSLGFCSKSW